MYDKYIHHFLSCASLYWLYVCIYMNVFMWTFMHYIDTCKRFFGDLSAMLFGFMLQAYGCLWKMIFVFNCLFIWWLFYVRGGKVKIKYTKTRTKKKNYLVLSTLGLADFAKIFPRTLSVHVASDKLKHKTLCLGKHLNPEIHLYFNLRLKIRS